jgi:hypothetical protein
VTMKFQSFCPKSAIAATPYAPYGVRTVKTLN